MGARRANEIDVEVGERIKRQRVAAGWSQTRLAEAAGVTFQQIQKYERGANRVVAGRLSRIADALKVPVATLYLESEPSAKAAPNSTAGLLTLLARPDALRLLKAFSTLDDLGLRLSILQMVEKAAVRTGYKKPKKRRYAKRKK